MSRPPPPPLPPQKISVFTPPPKTSNQSIDSELQQKILKSEYRSVDCATSLYGYELPLDLSSYSICSICKTEVKNQQAHSNYHATPVFPWLFLGSKENSSDLSELQHCRVTSIVNCTSEIGNSFIGQFNYYTLPIVGGVDNEGTFVEGSFLLESLRMDDKVVLVHCVQGVNRAAGMIIYYLMAISGMPLRDAYLFLKSKRNSIRPKRWVLETLVGLERNLFGVNSLDVFELCDNEND